MGSENTPPEVRLRPATPADAAAAAPLIYAAGPLLFSRIYGPRPEDAIRFFQSAFALPATLFSHENAIVAEQAGEIVGLASSLPATALRVAWPRTGRLMLRLRGPLFLLRLLPAVYDMRGSTEPTPADAYYLGILSVRADRRGLGLGSLLLSDVCRRARAGGYAAVCLHAELDNGGALRFYARHGFQVTTEHPTPRAVRWGVTGFASLRREIVPIPLEEPTPPQAAG